MFQFHLAVVVFLGAVTGFSAQCAAQASSQRPPEPKEKVPEYLRYPRGNKPKPVSEVKAGQFHANFLFPQIPRVIDFPEWEQYAHTLNLSNAQRKAIAETYDQYRRADWDFRLKNTESLFERAEPLAALGPMDQTTEHAAKVAALHEEATRLGDDIRQIESQFFQQVAAMLAENQLPLLDIARMRRDRKLAREQWMPLNGFGFDLDDALYELDKSGFDLTPREPEVFEGLVQVWRTTTTSAYVKHARAWDAQTSERLILSAEMIAASKAGERERALELRAKDIASKDPEAKSVTRIVEQQRQYVEQIAAQLGERARNRLLEVFNERMFTPLYPDPADLTKFLEAVDELSLTAEQKLEIADIRTAWNAEAALALKNYLDLHLSWREEVFVRGYGKNNYPEYRRKMSNSIDGRINRSETLINALLEVLSDKQDKKLVGEVKKWRAGVAKFREEQEEYRKQFGGWPASTLVR